MVIANIPREVRESRAVTGRNIAEKGRITRGRKKRRKDIGFVSKQKHNWRRERRIWGEDSRISSFRKMFVGSLNKKGVRGNNRENIIW